MGRCPNPRQSSVIEGSRQHDLARRPKAGLRRVCDSSLANEVEHDVSTMRMSAMLEDVDALPCAQCKLAVAHRYGKLDRCQCASDVRWHVIRTFNRVPEPGRVFRYEPFKEFREVALHIRIGVLLYDQTPTCAGETRSADRS